MRISDWSSDVCSSDLAERGAAPGPPGHQLERPGGDLLAGPGDADDDALAPSLVSTFKGLPHRLHVADALEGVVGAAAGQLDQMRHQVALAVLWVHEVGHAELGRKLLARSEEHTSEQSLMRSSYAV